MKITTMNPQIVTKDPAAVVALFESLGFVRTHNKTGAGEVKFSAIRLKRASDSGDGESFHLDVVEAEGTELQNDLMTIRINVDDFDEAYKFLLDRGFRESEKFGLRFTSSSKYAYLISPSGFVVDLLQHIRE